MGIMYQQNIITYPKFNKFQLYSHIQYIQPLFTTPGGNEIKYIRNKWKPIKQRTQPAVYKVTQGKIKPTLNNKYSNNL